MEDLKELIKQRNELNKKIRELQNQNKIIGCVKLDKFTGWGINNGFQVSVFSATEKGYQRYKSIIQVSTKIEVVDAINHIVHDLIALRDILIDDIKNK